jgi:Flp pilus assembly protein TadD
LGDKARVWNNLGYIYQTTGSIAEARQAYLRALVLNPDYLKAANNLERLDATSAAPSGN